ncbi:MAG TPA: alanyl-tRNA editing protein [Syntrophales bacterium]|nr:alanyl-tRNA editing protein [Syntrophales bacterium]HPQ45121.1 alanyl-tRNA editing protein [Syntrophales bacterium]
MTKKTFWENPYLTEIETTVTDVNDTEVMVDQTIFYAFSGGQESDYGTIDAYPVIQARKDGTEIIYTIEDGHCLQPGDRVRMTIDWERRYRLMRLHFAAEVILELAYHNLEGIEKIGAHIAQDKARLDFTWVENISKSFPKLEEAARRIIQANQEIESAFSDEEAERRYWKVEGFGCVSCGGTHLRRTGEIGEITLKRNNIGKGKERIEIYLNDNGGKEIG